MKPVIVLTTVGADFEAAALAHALVESRVAACVNIVTQVQSVYRWQGRITAEGEQLLVIKTVDDVVGELREELFSRHPYELPEFVVIPVAETSEAYGAWLLGNLSPQ